MCLAVITQGDGASLVVGNAQRDTIFIQQIQYVIAIPAPMTKLERIASLRRKQPEEGGEARAVLFELWGKLKQNRACFFAKQTIFQQRETIARGVVQSFPMRNESRRLPGKYEAFGRPFFPTANGFDSRCAIEYAVEFRRSKPPGVKFEPSLLGQIARKKQAKPRAIAPSRCPDQEIATLRGYRGLHR